MLYKPMGVDEENLETESLTLEEVEALKLKDGQELKQVEAAKQMGISRSTFQTAASFCPEKGCKFSTGRQSH
ncbi:MAG: DUF134 domain-containing protein [Actinomycetota bacterium]|nr:DUF134 domain-containing protein [Actinomycetota bacterium]